jgi:hypothetical protein
MSTETNAYTSKSSCKVAVRVIILYENVRKVQQQILLKSEQRLSSCLTRKENQKEQTNLMGILGGFERA